jgi:hypothetical protein
VHTEIQNALYPSHVLDRDVLKFLNAEREEPVVIKQLTNMYIVVCTKCEGGLPSSE